MLSMYCFRGLPHLRLPSTYPSTTVFVIWQPWSLQRCPKYDSLRTCPSNSRFMSSSCRILLSVLFSIQLIRIILRQSHISIEVILRSSRTYNAFNMQKYQGKDQTLNHQVNQQPKMPGQARNKDKCWSSGRGVTKYQNKHINISAADILHTYLQISFTPSIWKMRYHLPMETSFRKMSVNLLVSFHNEEHWEQ